MPPAKKPKWTTLKVNADTIQKLEEVRNRLREMGSDGVKRDLGAGWPDIYNGNGEMTWDCVVYLCAFAAQLHLKKKGE